MATKSEYKVITSVSKHIENADGDYVAAWTQEDELPLYIDDSFCRSYNEESFKQLIAAIKKMTGWKL